VIDRTGLGAAARYSLTVSGVKDLAGNDIGARTVSGSLQINFALAGTASQSSDLDAVHVASLAIDGNIDANFGGGSVTHTLNSDDPPMPLTMEEYRARILGAQQARCDPQSVHLFADPDQLLLFHS